VKLGVVSDEISRDFRQALEVCTALGIERVELRHLAAGRAPMCGDAAMVDAEEGARAAAIQITALSPGLFKLTDTEEVFRREMAEIYPRAAEWAHRWRLPGLIVFGFHKPGATEATAPEFSSDNPPQYVVDWLGEAAERAAGDDLLLIIEPEPICWCDTGRATADLIRRTGWKALRINYDPGNVAWLTNRDPIDELPEIAPLVANVHVKDIRRLTRGAAYPQWVPAGEGMIDYAAHFRHLRELGYTGPVSLEPHMDSTMESTRRCKVAVEAAWGDV
jgi:sugar phosphate isomerase/epimerase